MMIQDLGDADDFVAMLYRCEAHEISALLRGAGQPGAPEQQDSGQHSLSVGRQPNRH